jgi:glycosyltransferase involved in cell wall biosynthesis
VRVVMCWMGVSGYLAACWRALAARPGLDLKVLFIPSLATPNAPFDPSLTDGLPAEALTGEEAADAEGVARRVLAHRPEVIVMPGWAVPSFRALVDRPELSRVPFAMAMDNPLRTDWRGRMRQTLGRVKLRRFLSRVSRVVVPGERSWQYARFLGFGESQIRRGNYGADVARFRPLYERRLSRPGGWPRRFLFAGRYEPVKGIETLLAAYELYRRRHGAADAWALTCSGKGPLESLIRAAGPGVEDRGFVQPADQPDLWAECGAFLLSSHHEPWGVVIAEACAAGLPVVCTEACGAAVELVRSYFNGLTVATGDAADLARGMSWVHENYDRLPEIGRRGQALADAYGAEAYADRWMAMFTELAESAPARPE